MANEKILVVDDDANICELLRLYLTKEGYQVTVANDGEEGLEKFNAVKPDMVLLDVMMPRMDGLEVCRRIRKAGNTPVMMLTAKGETFDKVLGLELGADDYMVKPVDEEEMMLRIAALLRRSRIVSERRLTIGSTTLDYDAHTLIDAAGEHELPNKEFMLLYKLLSYPNHIFTRRQLMDEIWDMESDTDERTVDVHINRLRERLKGNADIELATVRGLGYKAVKKQ